MKRLWFAVIAVCFLLAGPLYAAEAPESDPMKETRVEAAQKQLEPEGEDVACDDADQVWEDGVKLAKRGCCSWHGGVCGCKEGRIVCCDATYSPTCKCRKAE